MKSDLDALATLAADLRAVLEANQLQGARSEWADAPLPEPIAPPPAIEPDVEVVAAPPPAPERAAAWAELAGRSIREEVRGGLALERVRADIGDCRRCTLCRERTRIVFGVGDPEADLVVCGEAPGYHEDQQGEPFVGAAGEMLDRMLVNVLGLQRSQAYILNVVKCRPPKNRNPLPDEIEACRPFLERQIDGIRPRLILLLGKVALGAMFGEVGGIKANRGKWREYRGIPVMPTFHPAYLLREPDDKRLTFADLKEVRVRYDALGGKR